MANGVTIFGNLIKVNVWTGVHTLKRKYLVMCIVLMIWVLSVYIRTFVEQWDAFVSQIFWIAIDIMSKKVEKKNLQPKYMEVVCKSTVLWAGEKKRIPFNKWRYK